MIRKLANILTIILSATALLACDQVFLGDDNTTLDGEYSVMMSGLVSEIGGGQQSNSRNKDHILRFRGEQHFRYASRHKDGLH